MGYYKVLAEPMPTCMLEYKGLYRSEPFPQPGSDRQFFSLWERYTQYVEQEIGLTTELTLDELKDFAALASQDTGKCYEVIYFDDFPECPHKREYLGIDVTGFGGYSMLGERFFPNAQGSGLLEVINQHFNARLNRNLLFDDIENARSFQAVLHDLESLSSEIVEKEDWRIVFVSKVG